jgi:hypothetical protein
LNAFQPVGSLRDSPTPRQPENDASLGPRRSAPVTLFTASEARGCGRRARYDYFPQSFA